MRMVKILAFSLALIMLLVCFAACGSTPSTPAETETKANPVNPGGNETGSESGAESETSSSVIPSGLPEKETKNYDYNMKVLHWTVEDSWIPWEEVVVETYNGDALNDTVYERGMELQEGWGITLENEYMYTHTITSTVEKNTSTGDDAYQLIIQRGYQFQFLMTQDCFANINSLPYVDTSKPWWNQDSISTFTFGGTTLFAASDMLLLDKGSTSAVVYNMEVANNKGMSGSHFYDMVNDYTWTLEALAEAAEQAYTDVDGDEAPSGEDIFGAMGGDDPIHFMLNAAGERFCVNTGDDRFLEYTFGSERTFEVVMDTLDLLLYEPFYISSRHFDTTTLPQDVFISNQVLFTIGRIKDVNKFRAMEADYGILPIPQYEESQHAYHCEISPHHDSLMAVPHTAVTNGANAEALGVALEGLSYISHYSVYPTLIDEVISLKSTRDQESRDMLKIIFDTRMYDIGIIFDFGTFANITLRITKTGNNNIASLYAEAKSTIDADLEKVVEKLHEIVD